MENRGGSITLFVCVRLCVFGVGVEKGFILIFPEFFSPMQTRTHAQFERSFFRQSSLSNAHIHIMNLHINFEEC